MARRRDAPRRRLAALARSWPRWSWPSPAVPCPVEGASARRPPSSPTSAISPTGLRCSWLMCPSALCDPSHSTGTRPRSPCPSTAACGSRPMSVPPSTAPPSLAISSSNSCAEGRDGCRSRHGAATGRRGTIAHTSLVPDVEQFVQAGSEVFGAISTTELEQIIEAGGEGFTGQEASLKTFLTDLSTVANGYAQHTSDITQAVNGLNSLTASLAPTAAPAPRRSPTCPRPWPSWPRTRRSSRRSCSRSTACPPRGAASSRTTTRRS